jgi:CRISPR-associated protein Cas2
MKRRLHIVAYDIGDPVRLADVLSIVREYATGGQLSVHECFLDVRERLDLRAALAATIDHAADRVAIVSLDPRVSSRTLGVARAPSDPSFFFLG